MAIGVEVDEMEATRRQLLRVGLDLHDGPLQDIAALGADLYLFRLQLAALLEGHAEAPQALGRIDDLVARLGSLDAELREIGISTEATSLLHGPLSAALANAAEWHASSFRLTLDLDDDLDDAELTDSQRIALIRVVQSAFANIAQHSGAGDVRLAVRLLPEGLYGEIADDGCGFDLDEARTRAASSGSVGLSGMRERVRLLGGDFAVESEPGRGTTIRVVLPRWSGRPTSPT